MNIGHWIIGLPARGLSVRLTVLGGVMLLLWVGALPVAVACRGTAGLAAVSLACTVCLASAAVAMLLSQPCHRRIHPHCNGGAFVQRCEPLGSRAALLGVLLPMAIRSGVPLLLALIVRTGGEGLVEAGLVYYLVVFYLLALAVEVPLSLPRMERACSERPRKEGWRPHG